MLCYWLMLVWSQVKVLVAELLGCMGPPPSLLCANALRMKGIFLESADIHRRYWTSSKRDELLRCCCSVSGYHLSIARAALYVTLYAAFSHGCLWLIATFCVLHGCIAKLAALLSLYTKKNRIIWLYTRLLAGVKIPLLVIVWMICGLFL